MTNHNNYVAQFKRDAPYAQYMGRGEGGDIWVEPVTDPISGITVTLAYTTDDGGRDRQGMVHRSRHEGAQPRRACLPLLHIGRNRYPRPPLWPSITG